MFFSALIVQWLGHLVVAEETWVRFPLGARKVLKLRAPACVRAVQMPYADAAVAIATRPLVTTTPVAGGTGYEIHICVWFDKHVRRIKYSVRCS